MSGRRSSATAEEHEDQNGSARSSLDPQTIQALELGLICDNPRKQSAVTDETTEETTVSSQFTMESFTVPAQATVRVGDSRKSLHQARAGLHSSFCFTCCSQTTRRAQVSNTGPYSQYSVANETTDLLPPQNESHKGKITLVLDLDETLVHSSFMAEGDAEFVFVLGLDSRSVEIFVGVRPGVAQFLSKLADLYELVLFTASNQFYADHVVDKIDPDHKIQFRLYRESCTEFSGCQVKDLSKLGRDLNRVIIVDNSSVAYLLQPYNAIPNTGWYDNPDDRELVHIMEFLIEHHNEANVHDFLVKYEWHYPGYQKVWSTSTEPACKRGPGR